MAEDPSMDMEGNAASASIAGLTTTDDIMPGVYEGGFKTWECAVDLAGYLAGRWDAMTEEVGKAGLHVIEVSGLELSASLKNNFSQIKHVSRN